MTELLSLPRRSNQNVKLPKIKFKSGLPINSLPGWEHIPMNSKLPMLKCPGNQVIFSKNKIGQSLRHLKQEFDSSGHENIPEYNPLHDTNLKTFYANERNLKRLRENGEITLNNDVICNLKDFNEYRLKLHKSQLYYILREMNDLEADQYNRLLITNAERITKRDHSNLSARECTYSKIVQRKTNLDQQKAEHYKKLHQKALEKFSYIHMIRTINLAAIKHKKALRQSKFQKYANVRNDLQRKHLISLKKLFQFKKDRLHKNLIKLRESREKREQDKHIESWNKRLEERIANQEKIKMLLMDVAQKKKVFIENHKRKYRAQWLKIQQGIKKRALYNQKKIEVILEPKNDRMEQENKSTLKSSNTNLYTKFQGSFDKLMDNEVCEALNAALDMGDQVNIPFESSDPIYKAAQFIMQHILTKFHKDLSSDKITHQNVYKRLDNFFDEAKKFVIFRATQIIASLQDPSKPSGNTTRYGFSSHVLFNKIPSTIGISSYQIHPFIEIRDVYDRKPTPAGSLTSVVIDSTTSLIEKTHCNNLCRNELVFIEHYVTKFKRELIVGIGRRVFAAIQCHFEHKIMDVRQELFDIDRKFLINQMTKSILSYSVNPLNFESNLKLCISTLSSDIIWSLQKQLLKPRCNPRCIGRPCIKCSYRRNTFKLCLFCNE